MDGIIPPAIPLILTRVRVTSYPKKEIKVTGDPYIVIEMNDQITHSSELGTAEKVKKGSYKADIKVMGVVQGDVKINLQVKRRGGGKQKLCHFWFNSGFINNMKLELVKSDIDVANKDKNCKIFKEEFAIECFFKEPDPDDDINMAPREDDMEENSHDSQDDNENNEENHQTTTKKAKDKRKSFYDYSDYGGLQDQIEFSGEEDSNDHNIIIGDDEDNNNNENNSVDS